MITDSSKVVRMFEYLKAVKNIKENIIRNVNDFEKIWWDKDLPNTEGFYLGGNGTNEEAWYEVHKQEIPTPPRQPAEIKNWIDQYDHPEKQPTVKSSLVIGKDDEGNELIELFDENSIRVKLYKQWFDEWNEWANVASQKLKIQQIYMELFTLYQRFQREGEELEIACGHGLLQWEIDDFQVSRHVLVTQLELIFNAKKGVFFLMPTSKGTKMETDMLLKIDFPNSNRLLKMENQVSDFEFTPLEIKKIKPFLQEVVHTISSDGVYKNEKQELVKGLKAPIISNSPGIFLRNIGGRLWQQELSKVVEKINEGFPVPETIKKLTTIDSEKTESNYFDLSNGEWGPIGEELLFPLSTNKEQQMIAQKLSTNSGVVIQGPPGTGKSHTIANLISHLLAHGKRVLVTSEKEHALKVLKDKIPEEIRSLCVSVLGGDSKSVKEIENSVRTIAENLDLKQPEMLQENIDRLTGELKITKRNIAKLDTMINHAAEMENESVKFEELELTPLEGTKWINDNSRYSWLPDDISPETKMPLSNGDLSRLFELIGILKKEDIQSLSLGRPLSNTLPTISDFSQKVDRIHDLEEKMNKSKDALFGWNVKDDFSKLDLDKWINKTNVRIELLSKLKKHPWLNTIIVDCIKNREQITYWTEFSEEVLVNLNTLQSLEKDLMEHSFVFPKNKNLMEVKEDLLVLKEKMVTDSKVSWFYKNVSGRNIKYLFEELNIDNLPIKKIEDIMLLVNQIELMTRKEKLTIKWNRFSNEIEGPQVEVNQKRYYIYLKELCSLLKDSANWSLSCEQEFSDLLQVVGKPGNARFNDERWLIELLNGLQALKIKKLLSLTHKFFENVYFYLSSEKDLARSHPLWNNLFLALIQKDKTNWSMWIREIVRLESLEEDYTHLVKLKETLSSSAPKWTFELLNEGGLGTRLLPPENLERAWLFKQIEYWLKEIQSKPKIEELEIERKREHLKEKNIIKELVAESAWKEQINRITLSQKKSLMAWLKSVGRIGSGTGKYANIYRKDASREMLTAKGAIPVWIMPVQRVIENFELTDDLFDVIIVDESSQSSLFALTTLLRAKKAIIVGDDNQISPESVGTEISGIHELIERHLYDIPNRMQFDIRTSLYDTANRVFESKIVLKEHFRCVPEIIQFSNDFMYDGMIDPLRLPLEKDMFDPPVKAIRVQDGYRNEGTSKAINEPEAEAIVAHIAECVENPKYKDKTFGVISLQGHDQSKVIENLLREKIGEEEMINRKLITGDAYAFQGDERDVIFLSMVIAPNVGFVSLVKKSDFQRYNVATSRARDQMILFHSVDLNHLKSKDIRYQLMQYCTNPSRVQNEIQNYNHEFDSDFERDVFSIITSRGYRVIPQVKIGTHGKKIDLVVEGIRTRLAIECDGDKWHGPEKWAEDIERQRVLERVGWTFWRIRGSIFYANKSKSMESLWVKLDEMGIEPYSITKGITEIRNNKPITAKEFLLEKTKDKNLAAKTKIEGPTR